jgi:NADH dehydrogenase FAD-containing subunit
MASMIVVLDVFDRTLPPETARPMMSHSMSDRNEQRLHVVIVGGGFGGLNAARYLRRAPVRITLIDRCNHHLFQPLLYQVAMAGLSPAEIASPIRSILRRQKNVSVLLSEVTAVDLERNVLRLDGVAPVAVQGAKVVAHNIRASLSGASRRDFVTTIRAASRRLAERLRSRSSQSSNCPASRPGWPGF